MKKIVIEVDPYKLRGFEMTFYINLMSFSGKWTALPGHMPLTKGYFNYHSLSENIMIWDRELSFLEEFKDVTRISDATHKLYGVLHDFGSRIFTKKEGKGAIYERGSLKNSYGFVQSSIFWRLKSVC